MAATWTDPRAASQAASRALGYKGAFGAGGNDAFVAGLNPQQKAQWDAEVKRLTPQYAAAKGVTAPGVRPTTTASMNQYQQQALYDMGRPQPPVDSRIGASYDKAASAYTPESYKPYMNPYLEDVIGRNASSITRGYDVRRNAINEDMAAAGGFGSSAQGVERALTNEAELRQIGDMDAQLRAQGFDTASGLARQDATGSIALGNNYQGLDQYGRNVTATNQDRMLAAGDRIQGQGQRELDAYYAERDKTAQYPYQQLDFYRQLLAAYPTGTTSTTSQPGVGRLQGAAGGALLGSGVYKAYQ